MVATRRRGLLLAGGTLLLARIARAEPAKVRRVGVLTGTPESFFLAGRFEQSLRKVSSAENLQVLYRYHTVDEASTLRARAELLKEGAEVLVLVGLGVSEDRLASIADPVACVALFFDDPVTEGRTVMSLARPGGNLTGVMAQVGREFPKFMETVRAAFPKLKRLGLLSAGEPVNVSDEERDAAARFAIELVPMHVAPGRHPRDVLVSPARPQVDATWVALSPEWSIPEVTAALSDARMPAISDVLEFVEDGGLMAFGTGVARQEVFAQLARQVDRILRGTRPGDIPIEFPASPGLAINLRTARRLGYVMPPAIQMKVSRLID